MQTPQTIVIIGGGEVARGIAYGLSLGRDRVLLCDEPFSAAQEFAEDLRQQSPRFEVEAVQCSYDAVWEADIIILTLPCSEAQSVLQKIGAVANQKVIITVESAVNELQPLLPHTKMVQAFDHLDTKAYYESGEQKGSIDCPVSGCNNEAVQTVAELVRTIGFRPVILQEGNHHSHSNKQ